MNSAEPLLSRYFHQKACKMGFPISGTFELTPRCNFNCKMCYIHDCGDNLFADGKRELTADEWLEIARISKEKGVLFLLLTGGEPTLRKDFKYIYTELCKMGFLISINSNGSLIEGDILELFKKNPPQRINMTLYGSQRDTYKNLCENDAFERVVTNLRNLKEAGIAVKLNVTLSPYNIEDFDGIRRIASELEIPFKAAAYLYPAMRKNESNIGKNDHRFTPEVAAIHDLECDRASFEEDIFIKRVIAIHNGRKPDEVRDDDCDVTEGEEMQCRAGRSSFWLSWDGRMMPCGMMNEPCAYPLRDGFDAAWEQTKKATLDIRLPAECKECNVRHLCHICAATALCETGSFSKKPQYVCDMIRRVAELYEEEYNKLTPEQIEAAGKPVDNKPEDKQ